MVLEDLAAHFKLKTQNVIDRIDDLQKAGTLTGTKGGFSCHQLVVENSVHAFWSKMIDLSPIESS